MKQASRLNLRTVLVGLVGVAMVGLGYLRIVWADEPRDSTSSQRPSQSVLRWVVQPASHESAACSAACPVAEPLGESVGKEPELLDLGPRNVPSMNPRSPSHKAASSTDDDLRLPPPNALLEAVARAVAPTSDRSDGSHAVRRPPARPNEPTLHAPRQRDDRSDLSSATTHLDSLLADQEAGGVDRVEPALLSIGQQDDDMRGDLHALMISPAKSSPPEPIHASQQPIDARQAASYTDTISGTLTVVADSPLQHHASCCGPATCTGRCASDCRHGVSCGNSHQPGLCLESCCEPQEELACCSGASGSCAGPEHGLDTGWLLGEGRLGLRLGGWLDQSFTLNASDPETIPFNGPVTFIDRANEYQLNQFYLYLERPTDTTGRWIDIGGRADLLYGTDARFTLAQGLDENIISDADSRFYKMSFPQMYAEVAMGKLAVQMGRFYTLLGYETVTAPDNLFISHSYAMQYGEPKTQTGLLGQIPVAGGVGLAAGFTRGWDNWEDNNNDLDVLAGIHWASADERRSLAVAVTSGPQDDAGLNDRTVTSVVFQQCLGSDWNYVFHGDVGWENNGGPGGQDAEWYGYVNYLTRDINDCWSLGSRYEWFSDDDGTRVMGLGSPRGIPLTASAAHWQELALGINYRPRPNWLVRSEARWDWANSLVPVASAPFDDFTRFRQMIWSTDLVIGF